MFGPGFMSGFAARYNELTDQETQERVLQERTQQQQDFQREMQQARQAFQMDIRNVDQAAARRKEEQAQQSQMNILFRQASDFIAPEGMSVLMDVAATKPFVEAQAYIQDNLTRAQTYFEQFGTKFPATGFVGTGTDPADLSAAQQLTDSPTDAAAMLDAGIHASALQGVPRGVGREVVGFGGATTPVQRTAPVEAAEPLTELPTASYLFPMIPPPPAVSPRMTPNDQSILISDIEAQVGMSFDMNLDTIKQRTSQINAGGATIPNRQEKLRVLQDYDREFNRIAGSSAERQAAAQTFFMGNYLDQVLDQNPTFANTVFMSRPSTGRAVYLRNLVEDLNDFVTNYGQTIDHHTGDEPFRVTQNEVNVALQRIEQEFGRYAVPIDLRLDIIDLPELPAEVIADTAPAPAPVPSPAPTTPETVDEVTAGIEDTDFTQVDPEASQFVQDVQRLVQRGETVAAINSIGDRLATGRYGGPAGNPLGRAIGYFRDSPEEAEQRRRAQEAVAWYRDPQNIMQLQRNPALIEEAILDPFSVIERLQSR
jgi:hypothetical protein